ncbi:DUF288 domain-containing protein [candidate division WS5 bacterium]|uniref:DUF288 domain-containing protein n=1 Tax=candidate division WS5 bacterium TaxID=2093353 RepID=A0A419DBZ3_9BACT|nr:MAG: DUF288 domain-containing protein [candidate division WS5 bacterium]
MDKGAVVITSIQAPTKAVLKIAKQLGKAFDIIVIGDKKSPRDFTVKNVNFYNIEQQEHTNSKLAKLLPYNHYGRKNIGYIIAMRNGAELILETDDDNIPYEDFGADIKPEVKGSLVKAKGWFNAYKEFTSNDIWPRGFPLEQINQKVTFTKTDCTRKCYIQQFLADKNPDVDAVYRLSRPHKDIIFKDRKPVILGKGTLCPFNSQNTVTYKEAFPLLYLPSHVSFRMTDIWRSFIAQVIMWSMGWFLSFHSSTVYQERNVHNLLKDFEQEVPGYLKNQQIIDILNSVSFTGATGNRLYQAYEKMTVEKIIDKKELKLVEGWLKDLDGLV